jgi:hypothetical protein
MNLLSLAKRQIAGLLDCFGTALDPKGCMVDRAALAVTCVAFAVAALVFWLVPVDPARLTRFTVEHVTVFNMVDSTPQRLAFMAFLATLLSGAIVLRVFWPSQPVALQTTGWQRRAMAVVALLVAVVNVGALSTLEPYLGLWVLLALLPYLAVAAVFIWNHRLPIWLVRAAVVPIVLLAWVPAATGLMLRIDAPMLPWVDQHLAGVFSSAHMLAFGRRLFVDVPANYGVTVQVAVAAALKGGHKLDLGSLIRLTEVYQAITLCLFALAAWVRTHDAAPAGRTAAVLLVVLVTAPFLAMSSPAVLLPNQSGLRFAMLPVAALTAHALERWPFARASGLAGAVAVLALLHNTETGIAILSGLGLGWLVRARSTTAFEIATGLIAGLTAAAVILCLAAFAHFAVFGIWPIIGSNNPLGLAQRFAAGYGGTPLPIKFYVAFIILLAQV